MVWTRRGDVRIAVMGAAKIGESWAEKPRLFSTFFKVVAIRLKSVHCPTCFIGSTVTKPCPHVKGNCAPCSTSRDNCDGAISGRDFTDDHGTTHATGM